MRRGLVEGLKLELRPMLGLAVPVVLAELGWMAMGVVDTVMVGRLGAEPLGAVGVGRAVLIFALVSGIGLLLGLDTLISNAFGAGRLADCRGTLVQGVYLAGFATLPLMGLVRTGASALDRWGVDPAVYPIAVSYVNAVSWSILPLLLFTAFRRYLQAVNLVRPVMIALVGANLVNVVSNWVLIYGRLGAPALGAEGAGWATALSSCFLALFLGSTAFWRERGTPPRPGLAALAMHPATMGRLLRLGIPAAAHLVLEVGVFALATALAARLDPSSLAAHQIALTAASVTFMVPLGLSSAAAVRVGQALGRGDPAGAGRAGWTALLLGSMFMSLAALVFVIAPRLVIRAFTDDARVLSAGVTLLLVAAAFQLFDGLQVVATGALRGAGDTRTPLLTNGIGYWLVGLPVGYSLCFLAGRGVVGLWLGLCTGLVVAGPVLLAAWSRRVQAWRLPARAIF